MTEDWQSIPAMFFDRAARKPREPFLWRKDSGKWLPETWGEAAETVRCLAGGLQALGLEPGDRVAIVAANGPEWVMADLAIMAAGGITVPAYVTYTSEDHRHVLADSGAKLLVLGSRALAQHVLPAADQLTGLQTIIALEPLAGQHAADIVEWREVLARGREARGGIDAVVAALEPDDTACLIYTSGTGGPPKGVMLTHRNMLSNAAGARKVFETAFRLENEVFLSFLPLTHSYEHTAGLVFPISIGAQTYFSAPETLATDMPEVRPTLMTAVPRLLETLQKRIIQAAERSGGWRLALFREALRIGTARIEAPHTLAIRDRLIDPFLDLAVRRRIARRFGGRLKAMISGGAPLGRDVALFFLALGVRVLQGYGQTETGPVVGVNPPMAIRVDTVGPPLEGVEVRIAEDGEVLVRGPNVMKGYWRDPELTARTMRDGWLHTGDVGALDPDGYLRITDRKRDFIKTSGGDMIAPQRIEALLTARNGIAQAIVHGDRRPYLVALIVPEDAARSPDPDDASPAVAAAVAAVNRELPPSERIRRHAVLDEPFTIANGQMTPTLKIKRHVIRAAYTELIETLYVRKRAGADEEAI